MWCVTLAGRRLALDPRPHPDGTVVVTNLPDGTVRGSVLTGEQLPAQVPAHRVHERACPARPQPATGPRCGACREPMDEWLVEQGYTRHIGCLNPPPPARTEHTAPEAPAPAAEQDALPGLDTGGPA